MQPGSELDELVLNKVFGKTKGEVGWLQSYSTDIRAAWDVVDKIRKKESLEFRMGTESHSGYEYWVTFEADIRTTDDVWGESAPHAICLAALKAVGIEVK